MSGLEYERLSQQMNRLARSQRRWKYLAILALIGFLLSATRTEVVAKKALALLRLPENDDVQLFRCRLTVCFGRDVGLFLWPVRLPQEGKENQSDEWGRSALRICKIAEDTWVKMWGKRGGKQYSHRPAPDIRTTPPWPEGVTLDELATLGFEGRYIEDPDDPVIRRLLGKE